MKTRKTGSKENKGGERTTEITVIKQAGKQKALSEWSDS